MNETAPQIPQEHKERVRQNILELLRLVAREVVRRLEVNRDGNVNTTDRFTGWLMPQSLCARRITASSEALTRLAMIGLMTKRLEKYET